ncbi:hypothetical protein GBA52_011439 [Prunus armeniaca]|nr:hypothetical protein GBA52_011439 [Prunus armeniaca]
MGGEDNWDGGIAMAPAMMMAAQNTEREEEQWRNFNNSVNAVSLGFVATAILISMFLVMAIFERFFRPRSSHLPSTSRTTRFDLQQQTVYQNPKLDHRSPKMTSYAKEVSVVMPGEDIPTFIAHPAPAPCPRERAAWPLHQHKPCLNPSSSS